MFWILGAIAAIFVVWILLNAVLAWQTTHPYDHYSNGMNLTTTPAEFGLFFEEIKWDRGLRGWLIPTSSERETVIFVHGWAGCREERWVPFLELARHSYRRGMNCVLFDLGYVNGSRPYSGGELESQDLLKMVEWVRLFHKGPVIVWGFSAGGHATLLALRNSQHHIDCAITDSAFMDATDMFSTMYRHLLHLPKPVFSLISFWFQAFTGHRPKRVTSVNDTPVFVIQGDADEAVSVQNGRRLSTLANTEYWEVSGVNHEGAFKRQPDEYIRRCFDFIDRACART